MITYQGNSCRLVTYNQLINQAQKSRKAPLNGAGTSLLNLFPANVPILYPLKTPENQRFSGIFRGYKMGTLAGNGLNIRKNEKNVAHLYFHNKNCFFVIKDLLLSKHFLSSAKHTVLIIQPLNIIETLGIKVSISLVPRTYFINFEI